jgi:hypothetical protein
MEVRSRSLLLAVFGVWTGFLGMMAVVVSDVALARMLGAIALMCGLLIALTGLRRAVHHQPGDPPTATLFNDNFGSDS